MSDTDIVLAYAGLISIFTGLLIFVAVVAATAWPWFKGRPGWLPHFHRPSWDTVLRASLVFLTGAVAIFVLTKGPPWVALAILLSIIPVAHLARPRPRPCVTPPDPAVQLTGEDREWYDAWVTNAIEAWDELIPAEPTPPPRPAPVYVTDRISAISWATFGPCRTCRAPHGAVCTTRNGKLMLVAPHPDRVRW